MGVEGRPLGGVEGRGATWLNMVQSVEKTVPGRLTDQGQTRLTPSPPDRQPVNAQTSNKMKTPSTIVAAAASIVLLAVDSRSFTAPATTVTKASISISPTLPTLTSVSSSSRVRSDKNTKSFHNSRCWNALFSEREGGDTGPINENTSRNEFSRTIRVSKWFNGGGGGGGGSSISRSRKRMDLSIFATPEERQALANRFRLTKITALSADMVVQPAFGGSIDTSEGGGRGGGNANQECIEATGTVCAQVTQTCVRTNEEFDVSLEFSFETVLRAMSSNIGRGNDVDDEPLSEGEVSALDAASKLENGKQRKNKGGNKPRGGKGIRGSNSPRDLDGIGMKQMQDILMEYEVSDEIIEDESCFCTDGIVDCGEIVAQMFRSKLDPYPKKPGSVSSVPVLALIILPRLTTRSIIFIRRAQ